MFIKKLSLILLVLLTLFTKSYAQGSWSALSPDKSLQIILQSADGKLTYSVLSRKNEVIGQSQLGIITSNLNFSDKLKFISSSTHSFKENYTLKIGKRKNNNVSCTETQLIFEAASKAKFRIDLRAYNDGVAFRYFFLQKNKQVVVTGELSEFNIRSGKTWLQPYGKVTNYAPAYENAYANGLPAGTSSKDNSGWAFPALFKTQNNWILVTEAGIDSNFYGSHLAQNCDNGKYKIAHPLPDEGQGIGTVMAEGYGSFGTPWRTIIIGKTLATIVESDLVYHLSPPSQKPNDTWIKPGRSSWSWWGDHSSSKNFTALKKFVDLSHEMHWEYSLVDANWNMMQNGGNIQDLVKYANKRHVGLLLWYNSGGPHNVVTEQPRDIISDPVKRRIEFAKLKKWGVKGVKIDFFQSDKQQLIKLYLNILTDAAAAHLLVDFHGCTIPRGWSRKYPNLMSMEAVKGAENYGWDTEFAKEAPAQNTILTYTRNVVGPMDYTPVTFSDYDCCPHLTTNAHELALSVLFETGMLHFADKASVYKNMAKEVKMFMQNVPVTWDDTRFIEGEPGKETILARKSGDKWYVSGINGEQIEKTFQSRLHFLGSRNYTAIIFQDGDSAREIKYTKSVARHQLLPPIKLLPFGGFVAVLTPVEITKK